MVGKLDLDHEVMRLLRAKGEDKGVYVGMLPYSDKITILALGVIEGWYGDFIVQERILKDKHQEIIDRVVEIDELRRL